MYIILWKAYSLHHTVFSVQRKIKSINLKSVQWTLYSIQLRIYSIEQTVYWVLSIHLTASHQVVNTWSYTTSQHQNYVSKKLSNWYLRATLSASNTLNYLKTSLLRRLQAQTLPNATPPTGKIYPFTNMAVTFEPEMRFWCPLRFRKFFITMT